MTTAWAKGTDTGAAATELLLQAFGGRLATPGQAWVEPDDVGGWRIDWDAIPHNIDALSAGERRVLLIAASIAGGARVGAGDVHPGLDRATLAFALAAHLAV